MITSQLKNDIDRLWTVWEEEEKDQAEKATMSLLIPPQMLNTMNEKDLKRDPVRRYMIPMISDRLTEWPNHPRASRDSLHESEMWATEGLTQGRLRMLVDRALRALDAQGVVELLPESLLERLRLPCLRSASERRRPAR